MLNSRITATASPFPDRHYSQITDPDELANVIAVSARDDTATILIEDRDKGTLAAYAIIGYDEAGMVTIYLARSWLKGLGAVALKSLFQGATVINRPLRVHSDKLLPYLRMMGAGDVASFIDVDGINMGVFSGK